MIAQKRALKTIIIAITMSIYTNLKGMRSVETTVEVVCISMTTKKQSHYTIIPSIKLVGKA